MAHVKAVGATAAKSNPNLLSVSFNQDYSCVAVGTRKGYLIANCEPYGKIYSKCDGQGATSLAEMLFSTSLVALVGGGDKPSSSMRRLQIVNTKRNSLICELNFPTSILAVRLNRRRLVVVLEEQIYVYDISNLRLLHTIETSPNLNAICALSPSSDNCYLAYPSPLPNPQTPFAAPPAANPGSGHNAGDVLLFDAMNLSVTNVIQAHKTPLAALTFNAQGTMLATASDKGTVIRVFSVPNGDKIAQFRRGSYPAKIYSLAFNAVSSLLCASSDSDTVHVFKMAKGGPGAPRRNGISRNPSDYDDDTASSVSSVRSPPVGGYEAFIDQKRNSVGSSIRKKSISLSKQFAGSVGGFLPSTVTQMWEPQRDFASLKLPVPGVKSIVALNGNTPQVFVVTSEGALYTYHIDLEVGGECVLQKSYNLLDFEDSSDA